MCKERSAGRGGGGVGGGAGVDCVLGTFIASLVLRLAIWVFGDMGACMCIRQSGLSRAVCAACVNV